MRTVGHDDGLEPDPYLAGQNAGLPCRCLCSTLAVLLLQGFPWFSLAGAPVLLLRGTMHPLLLPRGAPLVAVCSLFSMPEPA